MSNERAPSWTDLVEWLPQDDRGCSELSALASIAMSLKRIADVLTAKDTVPESDAPTMEQVIVRRDAADYAECLDARFSRDGRSSDLTFVFRGHRWKYLYTSFDDAGDFDVLERPLAARSIQS